MHTSGRSYACSTTSCAPVARGQSSSRVGFSLRASFSSAGKFPKELLSLHCYILDSLILASNAQPRAPPGIRESFPSSLLRSSAQLRRHTKSSVFLRIFAGLRLAQFDRVAENLKAQDGSAWGRQREGLERKIPQKAPNEADFSSCHRSWTRSFCPASRLSQCDWPPQTSLIQESIFCVQDEDRYAIYGRLRGVEL